MIVTMCEDTTHLVLLLRSLGVFKYDDDLFEWYLYDWYHYARHGGSS